MKKWDLDEFEEAVIQSSLMPIGIQGSRSVPDEGVSVTAVCECVRIC
jgi:hypothetical protein